MRCCLAIISLVLILGQGPALASDDEQQRREENFQIQLSHHLRNLQHEDYLIMEESIGKLATFGKKALPELTKIALDSGEDRNYRLNAIYALGRMGKTSRTAIPLLLRMVPKADDEFLGTIAGAIGRIGVENPKALNFLKMTLATTEDEWVYKSAERALERIGGARAQRILREHRQKLAAAEAEKTESQ